MAVITQPRTLENLQEIYEKCAQRAPQYDRENKFFHEDFEDLREAGYLLMPVPEELGGFGMSLAEVAQKQRELAYYAAPTALGVNMHLYWIGSAADNWRRGDTSVEWLLREAAAGKVFAAGHAESGNDLPVVWSTTKAEKVEGGYKFTGRKSFGSLSPVWSYLGIHALDDSDPENPKIVHAFMPRESSGYEIKQTWDNVLGMRATRSDDTILNGVFVPDQYILRVVPAGFKGMDGYIAGLFFWFLTGISNVYYSLSRRVFDLTVEKIKTKSSIALTKKSMVHHAGVQMDIGELFMELEGVEAQLNFIANQYSSGVDYGPAWPLKFIAMKGRVMEANWKIVDKALDISGGFGIFPSSGLERLIRDARLGRIHPTNSYLSKELLGKANLGVDFDTQPRWG
ncbi:acyl-CoA/acyl-ACP dehydrogenase [Rhodocytophaga rosea]|uniref:Acyl-CoA/acyl-ACP dehydrogenase n=1 Tax=Rhodocytophaga rosea TaxID=2704465 RepID=A0A6C0GRK6_9BACT|nr:acyl-CoA dehydrogenase family protein [Rhodocytophaga rosea]QHT70735.1 acyl-CoA/acyl-ACP dehydrogenase [Rhodocytophaga rosea]